MPLLVMPNPSRERGPDNPERAFIDLSGADLVAKGHTLPDETYLYHIISAFFVNDGRIEIGKVTYSGFPGCKVEGLSLC